MQKRVRVSDGPVQKCCAEMTSVSVAGIPKNRCRTTVAEQMVETCAELPFIGDQVGLLSHDRPARSRPTDERTLSRLVQAQCLSHAPSQVARQCQLELRLIQTAEE